MRKHRRRRTWPVRIRDRAEYLGLRATAAAMRTLPVETGAFLMGWLWRHAAPLTIRHKRVLANLAIALPELEPAQRLRIASDQWDNLGRVFAESFQIDRIAADPERVSLDIAPELAERLERSPTGISIVSAHTGNWEVCALPGRRFREVAGLYQQLSNPLSDRYVAGLRRTAFPGGLFTKGHRTPGEILRWVRAGNAAAMLADGFERHGIDATFFGLPTRINPFPAMVARRLDVPLVLALAERLPGSRFRVVATEIPVPRTADASADVATATQAILDRYEEWIRARPGQWMWVLNVWRKALKRRDIVARPDRT